MDDSAFPGDADPAAANPGTTPAGGWLGRAWLHLEPDPHPNDAATPQAKPGSLAAPMPPMPQPSRFQAGATAPWKWLRGYRHRDGCLELPLLHTAGGLVGGDRLMLTVSAKAGSHALLTNVAAQKVYGSVGRSRQHPEGRWAQQSLAFKAEAGTDLTWLPQETVLYAGALLEQHCEVELDQGAGWLGAEVVRLGRSAAGETLGDGCWRSSLSIRRRSDEGWQWDCVDRLSLGGAGLQDRHGMAGQPVFGSLVWAAPVGLEPAAMAVLLQQCRSDRAGLSGEMACGALPQGLIARYRGPSSQAARYWFTRLWGRLRAVQGLPTPELPRVWPFQEDPWAQSS